MTSPLAGGFPVTFMLPTAFSQRPARWLEAITRFAGTHTAAPNFAYDVAATKIGSDVLRRLDLSSLRFAGNGSEPVRASTIETFTRTFGPSGFRAEALCTGYGMAEATLKVTQGQPGTPRCGSGCRPERSSRTAFSPPRAARTRGSWSVAGKQPRS